MIRPLPTPHLPWAVSMAPAALGVLPGAPPTPAPPLCSKGSFLKPPPTAADRPQECALALGPPASPPGATHACMTQAVPPWGGHPADSQTPHPTSLSCRLAFLWLRVKLLSYPQRGSLSSPVYPPPSCQRTHLSPIPGHQPWVSVPSCPLLAPQHPVLRLPAVTKEGIWYETKKQKPNLIYAISVCLYL